MNAIDKVCKMALLILVCVISQAGAEPMVGLRTGGTLVFFDSDTPTVFTEISPSGMAPGELIVGLDVRPATGQLYALGDSNRLYTVNTDTGLLTPLGAGPFTPALNGAAFGFDFDPVTDRARVVSDSDQNLVLNPDTGAVESTDASLAYAAGDANDGQNPNIASIAYSDNNAGAASTTLYGIDSGLSVLVRLGGPGGIPSPANGELTTIGSLGVLTATGTLLGFDISAISGNAIAYIDAPNNTLYQVNLTTGAVSPLGIVGNDFAIRALAALGSQPSTPPTTPPADIPTLSSWGLVLIAAGLAFWGGMVLRRRA